MRFTIPIMALAGLSTEVQAWWGQGHLLVSRIASDILKEKSAETIVKVENVLSVLHNINPNITHKEGMHPLVECATFADDIKHEGGDYQSPWHFIDQPYFDEGGTWKDWPEFVPDTHNITEAIPGIRAWFNKDMGYNETYIYKSVRNHSGSEEEAKSVAMRLLIHYAGDIHQPLHATSRVDSKWPKGDFGGNTFYIKEKEDIKELHAAWDSMLYEYQGYADLPFSEEDWIKQGKNATELKMKYEVDKRKVTDPDISHWAHESFEISKSFVYHGLTEDEALPETYVRKARDIAERQIVLAGHRLAHLLMSLNLDEYDYEMTEQDKFEDQLGFLKSTGTLWDMINDSMGAFVF